MEWKKTHDNNMYIKCFKEQVTDNLNANLVVNDLKQMVQEKYCEGKDIALVCYEKSEDFCHRHLVAKWLKENGYNVEELI